MKEQIEEMARIAQRGIDEQTDGCPYPDCQHKHNDVSCDVCEATKALYNAGYRKQKEGEWKHPPYAPFGGSYEMKRCSVCGYKPDFDSDNPYTKYCPDCGAKMKGGAE